MRRIVWAVILVMIGVTGPALVPDGVGRFAGEQRRAAEGALWMARRHLDRPAERLLVRSLRVVEVAPLEGKQCRWAVRVRAYSVFWFYRTVVVRCGEAAG
ncbi:MAG TPA: hypothetical protein VD973_23205 [Symbiobacteriaceae bacterium]|nr:hypothetical protein [Symbiobacteriaceae bacterium]